MKRTVLIELNDRAVRQFGMLGIQGGKRDSFVLQVFTAHRGGILELERCDLEFVQQRRRALSFSNCEDLTVVSRIVR